MNDDEEKRRREAITVRTMRCARRISTVFRVAKTYAVDTPAEDESSGDGPTDDRCEP